MRRHGGDPDDGRIARPPQDEIDDRRIVDDGLVLGMTIMVVTPPAAAASEAVARVSRYSLPGSPVNTRMSMRPGIRARPLQSNTAVPLPALAP